MAFQKLSKRYKQVRNVSWPKKLFVIASRIGYGSQLLVLISGLFVAVLMLFSYKYSWWAFLYVVVAVMMSAALFRLLVGWPVSRKLRIAAQISNVLILLVGILVVIGAVHDLQQVRCVAIFDMSGECLPSTPVLVLVSAFFVLPWYLLFMFILAARGWIDFYYGNRK